MAQLVKNPPAMQEIWVRTLGWEDPLEKGKATHSSILAWGMTEKPGGPQAMASQSRTQLTFTFTVHSYVFWWAIREFQNFTSLVKTFLRTQALQMQK